MTSAAALGHLADYKKTQEDFRRKTNEAFNQQRSALVDTIVRNIAHDFFTSLTKLDPLSSQGMPLPFTKRYVLDKIKNIGELATNYKEKSLLKDLNQLENIETYFQTQEKLSQMRASVSRSLLNHFNQNTPEAYKNIYSFSVQNGEFVWDEIAGYKREGISITIKDASIENGCACVIL